MSVHELLWNKKLNKTCKKERFYIKNLCEEPSESLICLIRSVLLGLDQIEDGLTPDWCVEVRDITRFQHFESCLLQSKEKKCEIIQW